MIFVCGHKNKPVSTTVPCDTGNDHSNVCYNPMSTRLRGESYCQIRPFSNYLCTTCKFRNKHKHHYCEQGMLTIPSDWLCLYHNEHKLLFCHLSIDVNVQCSSVKVEWEWQWNDYVAHTTTCLYHVEPLTTSWRCVLGGLNPPNDLWPETFDLQHAGCNEHDTFLQWCGGDYHR